MYEKFWGQFLAEQTVADPTFHFEPDGAISPGTPQRNRATTGIRAFLRDRGLQYDKYLGGGVDGRVYRTFDGETGRTIAVKFINTQRTSLETARREVRNYGFVKENRDSFGEYAKYLPVVYKAEMAGVPAEDQTMDGTLIVNGVIYMEELEPLPSEVARSLFAVGSPGDKSKAARVKRDRRLLKNPTMVSSLLNIAWGLLLDPSYFSLEAQIAAENKILERFFKGDFNRKEPNWQTIPWVKKNLSKQATELLALFINVSYEKMLENPEDENGEYIVRMYEENIKSGLMKSFIKAYKKPLVTGAVGNQLRQGSALKGFDTYFGREKDVEEEFPEIVGIRTAMKKFAGRDFKPFDVHSDNVMMRPGSNDIVIVDLGRFNL
jgi:hypothetical protein|tara:strand:+ start:2189 stop:3322 length:1134 start_codon:yes stop_codon:yes gene_type:complete